MKQFLLALAMAAAIPAWADAEPMETKKVCVDIKDKEGKDVIDPKTKQVKQNCKQIKQHKKLEGTDVPVKK